MVYGGRLARELMEQTGTPVLPLDSELSAIFQCLRGNEQCSPEEIFLTASGGPFRTWTLEQIRGATLEQALKHPNWSMGEVYKRQRPYRARSYNAAGKTA